MSQPTTWVQDPQSIARAEQVVSAVLESIDEPPELATEKRDLLIAASIYHEAGWSVLPVVGKAPPMKWAPYRKERMSCKALIVKLMAKTVTGVAVACGELSNVLIVDFDGEPGAKAFDAVRSLFPPGTLVARSGSGGYHAYFSFDGTRGAHPFTWEGERAGEIRGEGALVVLPPSKHPEGGQYEWINQ